MTFEPGATLGPYQIVALLGRGGMGEVYQARDTRLEREVALKVLRAELGRDPVFGARLEREAKTISQLQHPNVCTLYDVGSQGGVFYLVMEFLHGETVEDRLRRGPLPVEEVLRVGGQIAEAIEAAHRRGVVHRDLKPGNVILTKTGAKVLDFGLAREAAPIGRAHSQAATLEAALTAEGALVGTLPYMAPEQLEGRPADVRTDIWALGCILHEMATGERPFRGQTQAAVITAIMSAAPEPISSSRPVAPERLDWVVKRCLEKDPERRWHSARDVAIELEAIAAMPEGASPSCAPRAHASAPAGGLRSRGAEPSSSARTPWRWALVPGVALFAVALWWLATRVADPEAVPTAMRMVALPFQTLSDDPDLAQLARGIPQAMATRAARIGGTVLTPSAPRVDPADPCATVASLGPSYVYHGTLGLLQGQVSVSALLTKCPEKDQLWGDDHAHDATDLIVAQDGIVTWIMGASQQYTNLDHPAGTLQEYIGRRTRAGNALGLELAREAWRRDRSSASAAATVGNLLVQSLTEGWADPRARAIDELTEVADAMHREAPHTWGAQTFVGFASLVTGDADRAVEALRRNVDIAGELPVTHAWLGLALAIAGRPDEAISAIDEAVRLSPADAARYRWELFRGFAHFATGRYQEAAAAARFALSFNANDHFNSRAATYELLASSLAQLGERREAREAMEEAVRLRPALTLEVAAPYHAAASAEHRERYLEGLRRAGLGEHGLVEDDTVEVP